MSVEGLRLETAGDTLEVVIDRGHENSFSAPMMDALCDAIDQASLSEEMRFVHVRAQGPNFCVARDRGGRTPDELRAEATRIVRVNETCRTTPLTVVAEVQGPAAGFGAGLVASTDLAVASDAMTLSFPEILAGLAPTVVIGWLGFTLPAKPAFEMVATGRKMGADEALRWGLVTEVVAAERLGSRTQERLDELRAMSAPGLREIKRFLAQVRGLDPAAAARASIDPLVLAALRMRASDGHLESER